MAMGPVQMLVLGFAEPNFTGKIAAELDRLREHEFVKIVDALVVNKDDDGNITALQVTDLTADESLEMGAIAGALIGFGYGEGDETRSRQVPSSAPRRWPRRVVTSFPRRTPGTSRTRSPTDPPADLLLEHLWAIPLRDAIIGAGGIALADEWIHASDLIAVGVAAAAE